jgi:hypothetical protein
MGDENPHGVCTWDGASECGECALNGRLSCRWDAGRLWGFVALSLPFTATTVLGMVLTGSLTKNWSPQAAYAVFVLLFFTVVETRLLCRHCPHYAGGGVTIRCFANYGLLKLWRFQPGPMSRAEKAGLMVCFAVFGLYPVLTMAAGMRFLIEKHGSYEFTPLLGLIGLAIANAASAASFIYLLNLFYCPRCVNFSCPLNGVPEDVVEEYLLRNPVMKNAWDSFNERRPELDEGASDG